MAVFGPLKGLTLAAQDKAEQETEELGVLGGRVSRGRKVEGEEEMD